MKVQYVPHFLPCTHQDDIPLRTKYFVVKVNQFFKSVFVFDPSSCSRL